MFQHESSRRARLVHRSTSHVTITVHVHTACFHSSPSRVALTVQLHPSVGIHLLRWVPRLLRLHHHLQSFNLIRGSSTTCSQRAAPSMRSSQQWRRTLNSSPPPTPFHKQQSCSSVFGSIAATTTARSAWRRRTSTSGDEHSATSRGHRDHEVFHAHYALHLVQNSSSSSSSSSSKNNNNNSAPPLLLRMSSSPGMPLRPLHRGPLQQRRSGLGTLSRESQCRRASLVLYGHSWRELCSSLNRPPPTSRS